MERMAKNSKANSKNLFQYIKCRKPARKAVGPLDNEGIKRKLIKDMEIVGKTECILSVFTTEDVGQIPPSEQTVSGRESEGRSQTEVNRYEVLKRSWSHGGQLNEKANPVCGSCEEGKFYAGII